MEGGELKNISFEQQTFELLRKYDCIETVGEKYLLSEGRIKHFINMDKIWANTDAFNEITSLLKSYIITEFENETFDKLVVADKIVGVFGALPIACTLSLAIKIPLVIWKEVRIGKYYIYGDIRKGETFLILHDVLSRGSVITACSRTLRDHYGVIVNDAVTIVNRRDNKSRENFDVNLHSLLTLSYIIEQFGSESQ